MRLAELAARALGLELPLPDVEVSAVVQDHRKVRPGAVFVARVGGRADGHRFARAAVEAGAVAVVGVREGPDPLPEADVPYLRVADDRAAVARLAAELHGHPSRAMRTHGVTGTDGKTTTSFLLHWLLSDGAPSGLLSTAGARAGDRELPLEGHFTTPEAPEVQGALAAMRDAGCRHAVLEASSHGFARRRLDEVAFDVGVWTNLSPEHLDDHGSFEAYREAKLELARRARVSVLNRDDDSYGAFAAAASRSVSFGLEPGADWRAESVRQEPGRLRFRVLSPLGAGEATLPMIGRFNVHNALAALAAAAEAAGLALAPMLARLARFEGVPGRMQVVRATPFTVVVDFAHTPPALEKALQAVAPGEGGRRIVVIGAAGERDPGKRAPLGEVAVRHADLAVLTEEDHRSEELAAILARMAEGARAAGGREGEEFLVVPDRREAIREALARARPGDVVVLAGKGHERTLERGDDALPWNEAEEARAALAELLPE